MCYQAPIVNVTIIRLLLFPAPSAALPVPGATALMKPSSSRGLGAQGDECCRPLVHKIRFSGKYHPPLLPATSPPFSKHV